MSAFQQAFCLFPWLLAGSLVVFAGEAQAAPRGSAAWCQQMMNTPTGKWSINDRNAFNDHCAKQRAEIEARAGRLVTIDGMRAIGNMFPPAAKPVAKPASAPTGREHPASGSGGSPPANSNFDIQSYDAAQRARYQHYIDTHGGNAGSSASAGAPAGR